MKYSQFKRVIQQHGWTLAELCCDNAPPSERLLLLMDCLGLEKYERFVKKLEKEQLDVP